MKINYNFNKNAGTIKPMHAIGQPPFTGVNDSMFHFVSEAGMPYSRLHDVGGAYGANRFVDIHNVFRDFNADVEDEASYDFTFTDWLIENLMKHHCEPIFRLGETIENYHYIKAYRIFPPKDSLKWAKICEHIIRHYNYGWANGFRYNITYWEIWNEPDNGRDNSENQMWHGTKEEYYELYTVTSKHLKSIFGDEIKVGGYATCGFRHILSDPEKFGIKCEKVDDELYASGRSSNFIDFFEGFFEHIKKHDAPIDFFSWHSYLTTDRTVICAEYLDRRLNELGYGDIETQLNEWNNVCEDRGNPLEASQLAISQKGTSLAAAKTVSMMCAMQNTKTKILCYYDAQVSASYYHGMFNPINREPFPLYYAFPAFNKLYMLGNRAESSVNSENGIYTLAAFNGDKKAVLITNTSKDAVHIETNLCSDMTVYINDDTHHLEASNINPGEFTLPSGSFYLIYN